MAAAMAMAIQILFETPSVAAGDLDEALLDEAEHRLPSTRKRARLVYTAPCRAWR